MYDPLDRLSAEIENSNPKRWKGGLFKKKKKKHKASRYEK